MAELLHTKESSILATSLKSTFETTLRFEQDCGMENLRAFGVVNDRYIKGIGKVGSDVKLLLDSDKLLNETDLETISDL